MPFLKGFVELSNMVIKGKHDYFMLLTNYSTLINHFEIDLREILASPFPLSTP
ncbi:MAG: hypothetical protein ABIM42_04370 [candidate division WOR-3 bacterium]